MAGADCKVTWRARRGITWIFPGINRLEGEKLTTPLATRNRVTRGPACGALSDSLVVRMKWFLGLG